MNRLVLAFVDLGILAIARDPMVRPRTAPLKFSLNFLLTRLLKTRLVSDKSVMAAASVDVAAHKWENAMGETENLRSI